MLFQVLKYILNFYGRLQKNRNTSQPPQKKKTKRAELILPTRQLPQIAVNYALKDFRTQINPQGLA